MIRTGLTMTTAADDHLRPLPYLVSLGVVGAATAAVFFGVAFLLFTPPPPAKPVNLEASTQAPDFQEVPSLASNDITQSVSSAPPAGEGFGSAMPLAPSHRQVSVLEPMASVPTAANSYARRVRSVRHLRRVALIRDRAAVWRPDARAGPLPGCGFYGPPNINVGYINPR